MPASMFCVLDKPLAENLRDAETAGGAGGAKRALMVGFCRRFAPLYRELKTRLGTAASLRSG